jgi:hypothetical protein
MALRKLYIGTVGPFLFEDTDLINDADGDFLGESYSAIVSDGQILIEDAPTNPNHIVRLQDLANTLVPTFSDVTAGRALNTVYQNGNYLTFAQISLRLRENPSPTTLAPTTLAPTTLATTLAPTTVLTTPAPPTLAPTTTPLEGARANFLEEAVDPPTIITGIVAKALGGNEYVELTLSVIIPPNHYFMLEEDQPYIEILRWIEYQLGV